MESQHTVIVRRVSVSEHNEAIQRKQINPSLRDLLTNSANERSEFSWQSIFFKFIDYFGDSLNRFAMTGDSTFCKSKKKQKFLQGSHLRADCFALDSAIRRIYNRSNGGVALRCFGAKPAKIELMVHQAVFCRRNNANEYPRTNCPH